MVDHILPIKANGTSTEEFNMDKPQETAAATAEMPKRPFPIVPTTKILATGRFTAPPTPEQIEAFFPKEVPATLKLYLAGKIDQWWARQDQKGPVFLRTLRLSRKRGPCWMNCLWARRS